MVFLKLLENPSFDYLMPGKFYLKLFFPVTFSGSGFLLDEFFYPHFVTSNNRDLSSGRWKHIFMIYLIFQILPSFPVWNALVYNLSDRDVDITS